MHNSTGINFFTLSSDREVLFGDGNDMSTPVISDTVHSSYPASPISGARGHGVGDIGSYSAFSSPLHMDIPIL